MTTASQSFDVPDVLATAVVPFAKAFGLNEQSARLILLQMAGSMAGGSIQTTSPNQFICTPAFDVAGIHNPRPLYHGALVSALNGVHHEIAEAMGNLPNLSRRELVDLKVQLLARLASLSKAIKEAEHPAPQPGLRTRTDMDSVMQAYYGSAEGLLAKPAMKKEALIEKLQTELGEKERQLTDLLLVLHPGVVNGRDEWRDYPNIGKRSFDGHYLQIATAESLRVELGSTSNQLRVCLELLKRSRGESILSFRDMNDSGTRLCLHLHGDAEVFTDLLRHRRVSDLGLLNSFVFCDAGNESAADADAITEFNEHPWHESIRTQLRLRAAGLGINLNLDREGFAQYVGFLDWCWNFIGQLPMEQRAYFQSWPELAVRIATTLAMLDGVNENGQLAARYLTSATALLQDHAGHQAGILERLLARPITQSRLNADVDKLVQRLREKGPQTRRDLARSYSGQNYSVIDGRLFEAIRSGRVVQSGNVFSAASVSVNASTEPDATKTDEGVAA